MTKEYSAEAVLAFNQGCDARLAGLSRSRNPYRDYPALGGAWNRGWKDVDWHWGIEVFGRWWFKPLPQFKWERRNGQSA